MTYPYHIALEKVCDHTYLRNSKCIQKVSPTRAMPTAKVDVWFPWLLYHTCSVHRMISDMNSM